MNTRYAAHEDHTGDRAVSVGQYMVYAGGTQYWYRTNPPAVDVVVVLTEKIPTNVDFGDAAVLHLPLIDFGGVPDDWADQLRQKVLPLLESGKTVLAHCVGSHGRTGTFLASLVALLEPKTRDPIAAVRRRHCLKAVETKAQAIGIFAIRGKKLHKRYEHSFHY